MARNRIRLPWTRGRPAAKADASFFEPEAAWRPRPDSPELSVFTPEEEAESHRRWQRAVLREKLRGPVSGAERLGLGLSAAGLAALVNRDGQPSADDEAVDRRHEAENAGDVLTARKPAPMDGAEKAPINAKTAGPLHAFLDGSVDNAFSSPVSSRADNGAGVRRAAPRGGGAPLESRVGGGGERTDAAALRKADQAPADARAPLLAEGVAAVRSPMEAEAITMAIAMGADVPNAREDQDQAEAKTANAAGTKANGGRAPAEEPAQAKAKDAPPTAEARADGRQGAAVEASVREKAGGDAPLIVEAKATDAGRSATDAPGRAKARDTEAVSKTEANREEDAAEAPVEAKAKDVSPIAEADAGLGRGPAKASPHAKAVEVEVVEAKADTGRGQVDAPGQTKAKDAPPVLEVKTDAARVLAEAPEQTMARDILAVVETDAGRAQGPASAGAAGRLKAKDATAADAADQGHGRTETPAQAKAADIPVVEASPDPRRVLVEAPTQEKDGPASIEAKAESGQRPAEAAPQQLAKAKDVGVVGINADPGQNPTEPSGHAKPAAAIAAKTDPGREQAQAAGPAKASDAPIVAEVKAEPGREQAQAAGPAKAVETPGVVEAKAATGGEQAQAAGPAKAVETPGVVEAKAGPSREQAQAPQPARVSDASITADNKANAGRDQAQAALEQTRDVPVVAEAKAEPGRDQAQAPGQVKAVDPTPVTSAKAEPGRDQVQPPGPAKASDAPVVAEVKAEPGREQAQPPGPAKASDAPVVLEAKPDKGRDQTLADGPIKATDTPVVAEAGANADHGQAPATPRQLRDAPVITDAEADAGRDQTLTPGQAKAIEPTPVAEPKVGPGREQSQTPGPAKANDAPPVVEAETVQGAGLSEAPVNQAVAKDAPVAVVKVELGGESKGGPARVEDVAGVAAKPEPSHGPVETPGPAKAKDALVITEAKADTGHVPAETPGQGTAKEVPLVIAVAANAGLDQARAPSGQLKDAPQTVVETKADPGHMPAKTPGEAKANVAEMEANTGRDQAQAPSGQPKDVPAITETKAEAGRDQAQAPSGQPKDVPATVEVKSDLRSGELVEALATRAPAKDVAVGVEVKADLGTSLVESPEQAKPKDVPIIAEASPGVGQRLADPLGPAKDASVVAETKAEQPSPPVEVSVAQAKQADLPTHAQEAVQKAPVKSSDAAAGVPAIQPAADALSFHAPDLWPKGENGPAPGHSYVPPPEKATSPALPATDLVGANAGPGNAATHPAESGPAGSGATISFVIGSSETGAAGTPVQGVLESASGKGNGFLPPQTVADATSTPLPDAASAVGAGTQGAAPSGQGQAAAVKLASAPGDTALGVVPVQPTSQGQMPAMYEPLFVLHDGGTTDGGSALRRVDLDTSVLDHALHYPMTGDVPLL